MLLTINPDNPQQRLISRVADILKNGGLIAYPTDTYYGIGCDIMNKRAIERIYLLKQRNKNQPFFILTGSKLVPKIMLTKRKTAGIRVPANNICLTLVDALSNPVISTSATMPDGEVFHDASLIHDHFGSRLDAVIDGGPVAGMPSSVVSLEEDVPEIIREGLGDVSLFK
ncbi:MAG: Sua5/YciO/YrdC/YwlC family protein [Desulfosarcina sp.]|nr:Sua5/YciO/YrdC/YwlC family protein [Desulfosarcina sp.]